MKCFVIFAAILVVVTAENDVAESTIVVDGASASDTSQQLVGAASNLDSFHDKKQEKRYIAYNGVGGYGGYAGAGYGGYTGGIDSTLGYQSGGYYNPYSSSRGLGLDSGIYSGGYNTGYGGYNTPYTGYNAPYAGYTGGYNPYYNSYSSSRLGYPYSRPGYGYNSYPSSYYSSNYANSIVGGGLGGVGAAGIVPPVPVGASGYQYGPGISGSVY